MDRYWLLTWTTYGSWLPGDRRGFVSELRDKNEVKFINNEPHTPCDADLPELRGFATSTMTEDPVLLDASQAETVNLQIQETAAVRVWSILACAVMSNHVHVVVGIPGDPDPAKLMGDFKSWATRRLRKDWPGREHWWTQGGSTRSKKNRDAIRQAVVYVRDQKDALVVYLDPKVEARLKELGV